MLELIGGGFVPMLDGMVALEGTNVRNYHLKGG
jgi:hypothetical protein